MKMMNKVCALLVSAALCAGMAAPALAFEGDTAPVEQPVLPEVVEEDVVTVTDEESGALTPESNLTLVDDYHTDYSDGSGQQFITLVSKSGNTFYLVIDRNAKGQQTVHFMNLVDEADLLALMEEEDADAYTAEKEAAAQAAQERKQAEEDAKKAAEEAEASGSEQTGGNKVTKYAATFLGVLALVGVTDAVHYQKIYVAVVAVAGRFGRGFQLAVSIRIEQAHLVPHQRCGGKGGDAQAERQHQCGQQGGKAFCSVFHSATPL